MIRKNRDLGVQVLTEAGLDFNRADLYALDEAAQLQVSDEVLNGLMKFITDKYNSIDFSEIERSTGDIRKFKYYAMIQQNLGLLDTIYSPYVDSGAKKYMDVVRASRDVLEHLDARAADYSTLYKSGNGMIQLLYTSLVAGVVYSTGVLISNTIRFVTTEQGTEYEVLYDEIPSTIKNVHIKNVLAAAKSIPDFNELLNQYSSKQNGKALKESVSAATLAAVALGVVGVIILIPRILILIREIIYSIYFNRVRVAEMLQVQIDLINTNIESLEAGRGTKKVIAKQKKIVEKLEKWKNKVALKVDATNALVIAQKNKENAALRVDRNSPIMQDPGSYTGDLML